LRGTATVNQVKKTARFKPRWGKKGVHKKGECKKKKKRVPDRKRTQKGKKKSTEGKSIRGRVGKSIEKKVNP